jgi:hypothetical protein
MISYEELCAALEAFKARTGGQLAAPNPSQAQYAPPPLDPLTAETMLPPEPQATLRSSGATDEEEGTQVGGRPSSMVYEDQSNELDLGDVLSDEESK